MAVITGTAGAIIGGAATVLGFLQSIIGEGWTRYFILIAGLSINNAAGIFTGIYPIESLVGYVVGNVFGVANFSFPIYYGLSSLLIIFVIAPLIFYLIRKS